MSANAPLLTTSSRLSATQNADNYAQGVQNHINGDLGQHYQVELINENWTDSCGKIIPQTQRLRLLLTVNGVDVPVVIPVIALAKTASATGIAPAIVTQPQNVLCGVGQTARFSVVATGDTLLYQWLVNGIPFGGATSAQFTLTNTNLGQNNSAIQCLVSNAFGQALSSSATLQVSPSVKKTTNDGFDFLTFAASGGIFGGLF